MAKRKSFLDKYNDFRESFTNQIKKKLDKKKEIILFNEEDYEEGGCKEDEDRDEAFYNLPQVEYFGKYNYYEVHSITSLQKVDKNIYSATGKGWEKDEDYNFDLEDIRLGTLAYIADLINKL